MTWKRMFEYLGTSSPLFAVEYLWTFDTTFQDDLAMFNAIPVNNATFSSTSITGYGSSLSLSSSLSQYLNISSPQLKLYDQSWTFEAWIFITNITSANEFAIVGQCKPISNDTCLHLVVKFKHLYFGTWFDDLTGNTTLLPSRWYHVAFTFDCDTRIQSVYLDGVIDGSRQADVCFQGRSQSLTIGAVDMSILERFFDGLIDQLSFTNRTRSADEILRDATMTAHFSFDNDSIEDQGPLGINGSLVGDTSFAAGRVGQALEVQSINESYLQVQGLVLLGTSNRSYSFSIWIRPYLLVRSVIIYAASLNGNSWCLPLLGLTNSSHLITYSWNGAVRSVIGPAVVANNWTHVAVTYSSTNGLRLYVNGTLTNTSVPFSFVPSGTPLFLLLGNPNASMVCASTLETYGPYTGALDEFRLYSRELAALDVAALACP